jgi:hypothetical protein
MALAAATVPRISTGHLASLKDAEIVFHEAMPLVRSPERA